MGITRPSRTTAALGILALLAGSYGCAGSDQKSSRPSMAQSQPAKTTRVTPTTPATSPSPSMPSRQTMTNQPAPGQIPEHETAISKVTKEEIPGDRLIDGRVLNVRSDQIEVDIGNPQPLYLPLKPAIAKGETFREGDPIVVIMNDHNAVVDYHHKAGDQKHQVIKGQLAEPLTVGLDKAVIRTEVGERSYWVASRARAKLEAMPIGADVVFLADETGQIVDAQLGSAEAVQQSAMGNKAHVKGAHRQVQAIYKGTAKDNQIKVALMPEQKEETLPIRPPLQKLDRLKENQGVTLLMDDQGYVVEIATPDVQPVQ